MGDEALEREHQWEQRVRQRRRELCAVAGHQPVVFLSVMAGMAVEARCECGAVLWKAQAT